MKISYQQVEDNIASIANRETYISDFIYELLAAYGRSASAITQLRQGVLNKANEKDSVLQKDVVYFKIYPAGTELIEKVDGIEKDPLTERYQPRYLIATDLKNIAAKDTKKGTTLAIKIADIDRQIAFFYGWTGNETTDDKHEGVADRRAADKMKELYAEIEKVNLVKFAKEDNNFRHELNVFFSRLLFCFFAEDTGLFEKKQFSNAIKEFTNIDGSDLNIFFTRLFKALDSEDKTDFSTPFSNYPYVNGTIFDVSRHSIAIPDFNAQARHLILECAKSNWSEINPDIFGTIFQSIVDPQKRDESGMDYTSVPNILKVIEPLFLDELHDLFDINYDDKNKLWKLYGRISKIKIFDPACGSGNFLIIAYKELRKLENAILQRISDLTPGGLGLVKISSNIRLENFYGIEIDDFAHEIAVLSLYLAAHQMNIEFEEQFGKRISIIPLIDIPTIIIGNATRLNWQEVCPNIGHKPSKTEQGVLLDFVKSDQQQLLEETVFDEIYLISNPPYLGQRNQKKQHKEDLEVVFGGDKSGKYKKLDYVCCWFMKGAEYIEETSARLSYISTNSVTQGVQIEQLWPRLFSKGVEIKYAYRPFKWINNARDVAGVYCVVISLGGIAKSSHKYIYEGSLRKKVNNINPYLIDGDNIIVKKAKAPLNNFHKMLGGCQPREGGYLMLDDYEKKALIIEDNRAEKFILPMVGSIEFLNRTPKWCIWIEDKDLDEAQNIPLLYERIEKVRQHRINGNSVERTFAKVPWKFVTTKRPKLDQIVIPAVTTSARKYIPIGFIDRSTVVNSRAYCLFDAKLFYFSILSSSMHNAWVKTVSGRLGDAINYSSNICYNTFPAPPLSYDKEEKLKQSARKILLTRENHTEMTLGQMYDPAKMPPDLHEAHNENDTIVDQLYRKKGFVNDEARLAVLFDLYEKMIKK